MLILCCFLIMIELKASEGRVTLITSGGGTFTGGTGSTFRTEDLIYIPTPYWKNGANKHITHQYDGKTTKAGSSFLTMGLFKGKSGHHLWDNEQDYR